MIKIFTSLSLFLLGLLAQAQTTETRTVSKFTRMEVGNNIRVIYTESTAPSISADANLVAEVKDGTLKINAARPTDETYTVYVSGNNLASIEASGAQITVTDQLSAPELDVTLEADATFEGNVKSAEKFTLHAQENTVFNGRVETSVLDATLNGHAKVCLTGKAQTATFHADNRTICVAGNFTANQMNVIADDYATVKIHAQDRLEIAVSEMARVTYTGKPVLVKMNENAIAVNSLDNAGSAVAAK
jgi:hypothetical protein